MFYYPLYLWWKITAVIPLRPREFILTPRNCLEEKEDGYYITLRRNQLKGTGRNITYHIDTDYLSVQYKIPDMLGKEILIYLDLTKVYDNTKINTLFVSDPHYRKWNQKKHSNSRYLTYINLNCIIRYFFDEVVINMYGYSVVRERNGLKLNENEIQYLYLGDTRHLALINLMAEGGTPVLAMMLAGHTNIDMSAHYYSNITRLIECKTYRQYKKMIEGSTTYEISRNTQLKYSMNECIEIDDGKCYSKAFIDGKMDDCMNAMGKDGEIGYCRTCCYYRPGSQKLFFDDDDSYKRRIEDDCNFLNEIVRQIRHGMGNEEDILQALMRLRASSLSYQQYCMEKQISLKENL